MRRARMWKVLVALSVLFLVAGCSSDTKKKPCDKNSVLACLFASGLNAVRGSTPVSVDVDGDGVVDGTLLSSKNDGILDVIDLNNDGVGDIRFIDSTGEGKGNIDGLDIDNDGFIDIFKTVSGNTTTLSTKKGGTGTTVSFLDTNADGKKDGFDLTKDGVSDTFLTLKGIDLNGDGKADAGLLDSNGDGVIDSIDLDGDLVADVSYIDTNADGVADAFDLNGDGTADIFYNTGKTPLLSTVKDGGGRTVLAVDKNRDGKYEGFDLDGDGAGEYAVTAIDFDGDGKFDGSLIDTNLDGKSDSIDINGDNIGDIAFLDTDNNGIPEGLDTNLDGTVDVYFSKTATQKLSTLINGGGSAVKAIDSNGDGSPDGFDTNGDGTIDVTIHTRGVPFKAGDKIDLDADGKVDGTLVDKDSDGKIDGIDVNADGRRDIVYSDANGDGKYDSLDSDGDGVIDVTHKPGQAPVLSNLKNGGTASSDGDKRVVTSSLTTSIVGFSTIDDQSYSVVAPVAISSSDAAPQGLKYDPSSLSLVKGTAMTAVTPTVSSGTVSSYSVSPTLPSGVSLNTTTGVISGTPSAVQQAANYTVTATNSGGTTTSVVSIGVDSTDAATGFSYSSSSVEATVGTAITPLLPTIAGTIDYCIVSPKLPAGLKLNRTTCEITGNPTTSQNATNYTVTAKGPGGDLTTTVSIKVNSATLVQTGTGTSTGTGTGSGTSTGTGTGSGTGTGTATGTGTGTSTGTGVTAPTSITYTGSPFTYTKGTAITTLTPTLAPSGVSITSCTVSPTLPAGLSINATTCVISGNPTAVTAAANYTVTATNSGGNVTTSISIRVNDIAPSSVTFTGSSFTYTKGTAITPITPTLAPSGVTLTSCTVNPTLPAGLSINATTCVISGNPSAVSAATNYTVTATNSGGNTATTITITVNDAPPTSVTYTDSPFIFIRGTTITSQTPILVPSGVTITNCTITPALPNGLFLDTTTCAISGSPSATSATATYTVTASNSAGSITTTFMMAVETPWMQEAYLKSFNGTSTANAGIGNHFGWAVSVDGDTVVVGAMAEDSNQTTITNGTTASTNTSVQGSGAVFIYKRTGVTWVQEAYLKAPIPGVEELFGSSVFISGDTVVVGAKGEYSNQTTITNGTTASADNSAANAGAAYVFKRTGSNWAQEAYLKAPNAQSGDQFGISVSISGDTIVVGAMTEDSNQNTITNGTTAAADNLSQDSGAAYIFKRNGTTWAQEAYLKAPYVDGMDYFGHSVAISGDTVVVGAYGEDNNQTTISNGAFANNNFATNAGAVYVFKRNGATWAMESFLKASNAELGDLFGHSVSIVTDTIVVGAYEEDSLERTVINGTLIGQSNSSPNSGAAYVFKRSGTAWSQEAFLKAENNYISTAGIADQFGYSTAISGDTVVVGANGEDSNQTTVTNGPTASTDNSFSDSGAVYVYKRLGTKWAQRAYIKAPNPDINDEFGRSLAMSGDTIVVGAPYEGSNQTTITNGTTASANNSLSAAGAVYIFRLQP